MAPLVAAMDHPPPLNQVKVGIGVDILVRAAYSKAVMINTLTWLIQTEGASNGGLLATHLGTQERVDALRKL
jgi:predicted Zn-dependent protease